MSTNTREGGMSETVDLTKIRVGDEVLVRGVAQLGPSYHDSVRVTIPGFGVVPSHASANLTIPRAAIVSHTPKALAVGDRVRVIHQGHWVGRPKRVDGVILGVDGAWAWVRDGEGDYITLQLTALEPSNA